ncbi:hypothetical protein B0H10DRAFT_2212826 [Mycena sp. CBHHK59/15]|nr:hypothetical protein B0H10DRAFT_2212826 [Mycena sp. CBHHK59/15]
MPSTATLPEQTSVDTAGTLPAFFTPKPIGHVTATNNPPITKANVSDDDMAPKTMDLFRGNRTAEKAHTWLRTLEQTWKYDAEEKEKLYRFKKGLHPADRRRSDEVGEGSAMAQDVIIAELVKNTLEGSEEVAGGAEGGRFVDDAKAAVRTTLPVEFRQLLNDGGLDTWEKYLKAVEEVGVDHITDVVEERTSRHDDSVHPDVGMSTSAPPPSTPAPAPRGHQTPTTMVNTTRTPWAQCSSTDVLAVLHAQLSPMTCPIVSLSGDPMRDVDIVRTLAQNPAPIPQTLQASSATPRTWPHGLPKMEILHPPTTPPSHHPRDIRCRIVEASAVDPHNPPIRREHMQAQNRQECRSTSRSPQHCWWNPLPTGQRTLSRGISQINEVPYNLFSGYDPNQLLYAEAESENGEEPAV